MKVKNVRFYSYWFCFEVIVIVEFNEDAYNLFMEIPCLSNIGKRLIQVVKVMVLAGTIVSTLNSTI